MEINTYCPECGNGIFLSALPPRGLLPCSRCGKGREALGGGSLKEDGSLAACGICGGTDFYRQKDFNRRLGLWILVIGFALALVFNHWFYPILIAMAALDLCLYFFLREILLCYACEAIYRGIPIPKEVETFDLARSDRYRFKRSKP